MFEPHGQYTLAHDHDIFILIGNGAWNLEASQAAISQINGLVDALNDRRHAFIFDTQNVEGITPDSFVAWSDAISYWLQHGFAAFVRVTDPESANYKLFIQPFDLRLQEIVEFSYAQDIAQGIRILHQLGFSGFDDNAVIASR